MKLAIIFSFITVLAGCSGSASDRPSSYEERQERINERAEVSARERDPNDAPKDAPYNAPNDPEPIKSQFDRNDDGVADADQATDRNQASNSNAANADAKNVEADNTKRNERDDGDTLTPLDQSNSSTDIEITQAIRKKVVGDDGLSFNAKNVKIITVAGKVTLRGPVESSKESAAIERTARAVPGVSRVDNQLEVK